MVRVVSKSFSRPDGDTQALYDVDLELSPQSSVIVPYAVLYRSQAEAIDPGQSTVISWVENGDTGHSVDYPYDPTIGPITFIPGFTTGGGGGYLGMLFGGSGSVTFESGFIVFTACNGQTVRVNILLNGVVVSTGSGVTHDNTGVTITINDTITVANGDVLTAEFVHEGTACGIYIDHYRLEVVGGSLTTDEAGPTAHETFASSTNVLVVTGQAETLAPGCDLTATGSPSRIIVAYTVAASQNRVGVPKQITFRLRRTNTSGAVLASKVRAAGVDSTAGNEWVFSGVYTDLAPTDGHYVVTVQETAGDASTEIWSAERSMELYY